MTVVALSLFGLSVGIGIMILSWLIAVRINFFSLVDVSWTYGIGIIGVLYGIFGSGSIDRRVLVAVLVFAWSVRLGTHLAIRLWDKFPEEDRRYAKIQSIWGATANKKFFWFFQLQAISQPLICLPIAFAMQKQDPISLYDYVAIIVLIIGIVGESMADLQLKRFKATDASGVCDVGLWRFSRHPNYFFEWVIWCGFSIFGLCTAWGLLSLVSPIIVFLLLNFLTGVPPNEEQSLSSKGELYIKYQQRTSRFFLWWPNS